jgi:dihydrofolate reductase
MSVRIFIAASLDGYIAASDGGLDWLNEAADPEGGDGGFSDFMKGVDAVLMGRATFETVVSFGQWPYDKPVIVLSNSLSAVPDNLAAKAQIDSGEPASLIERLGARGLHDLYIDGGVTIQRFLASDLVDEMTITRVPVVLGSGIPLFGELERSLRFRHVKTEVLTAGLVQSAYVRDRSRDAAR